MTEWPPILPSPAAIDPLEAGWLGDARILRLAGNDGRFLRAVRARAGELGLDISLEEALPGTGRWTLTIAAPGPAQHLAADRLIAWIDGVSAVLSGEYGRSRQP